MREMRQKINTQDDAVLSPGFQTRLNFLSSSNQLQPPKKKPALEDLMMQFIREIRQKIDTQDAIVKKLDARVKQHAQSQQQMA